MQSLFGDVSPPDLWQARLTSGIFSRRGISSHCDLLRGGQTLSTVKEKESVHD